MESLQLGPMPRHRDEKSSIILKIGIATVAGCIAATTYAALDIAIDTRKSGYNLSNVLGFGAIILPFSFVLTLPLTVIAMVAGLIFKRSIECRPATWSVIASFATWTTALAYMLISRQSYKWDSIHTLPQRIAHYASSPEGRVCLVGAMSAGWIFFCCSVFRNHTSNK